MSALNHLTTTASSLVLSSSEKSSIDTSISTLQTRLNDWFGSDIKEQIKFGSSTRGTILPRKADERSDIDYMIVFDNEANYKPQTFIERLKTFAEIKYSTSEIHRSHPTVVLMLNHIKFDLVPAYKEEGVFTSDTLYIPAPRTDFTDWISTDPNGFNQQLTNANNNNNSQIKPMIRLVKYWNACNGYVYDSFSMEQDLVGKFYIFCSSLKDYLFNAINGLSTLGLPQYKIDKVQRAKDIVAQVKEFERMNMFDQAEAEIKKLIPVL
jgi:predicted nucleotidyltransferase